MMRSHTAQRRRRATGNGNGRRRICLRTMTVRTGQIGRHIHMSVDVKASVNDVSRRADNRRMAKRTIGILGMRRRRRESVTTPTGRLRTVHGRPDGVCVRSTFQCAAVAINVCTSGSVPRRRGSVRLRSFTQRNLRGKRAVHMPRICGLFGNNVTIQTLQRCCESRIQMGLMRPHSGGGGFRVSARVSRRRGIVCGPVARPANIHDPGTAFARLTCLVTRCSATKPQQEEGNDKPNLHRFDDAALQHVYA